MVATDEKEVRVADKATVSDVTEGSVEPSKASEEEDTGTQIAPIVKLEEVVINTNEENEDILIDM